MKKNVCEYCNMEFYRKEIRKFCSHKCYSKNKKGSLLREKNRFWKGGMTIEKGYVLVKVYNHPSSKKSGYIREHRLLMEKHLGRYLNKNEIVHHINGIKNDNRIENLKIMTQSEHSSLTDEERDKKIADLLKEKLSYRKIGKIINIDHHSVARVANKICSKVAGE